LAGKTRKLFQVAKELNLATSTLTDELQDLGYEVTKKQMTPIEDEAYGKLLKKFAPERWAELQAAAEQDDSARQAAETQQVRQDELRKIMESDSSAPKKSTPSVRTLDRSEAILQQEPPSRTLATDVELGAPAKTRKRDVSEEIIEEAIEAEEGAPTSPPARSATPSVRGGVSNDDILAFTPAAVPESRVESPKKETKASRSPQDFTSEEDEDKPKKGRKRKRKTRRDAVAAVPEVKKGGTQGGGISTGEGASSKRRRKRDKRKKPDAAEVAATVKETLAAMDSGATKRKKKRRVQPEVGMVDEDKNLLRITEFVSTQELATLLDIPVTDLIKECLMLGLRVTINQRLERETVELLAEEHGYRVEFVDDMEQQEMTASYEYDDEEAGEEVTRAPVVTIMGHVDHGKTTLLDHLRKSAIVDGEAGGITQHIGAYEIEHNENKITFLDTPGHEAFTAMRARGAQVTDVVVLIVAADDQVMPQTVEAIDHAKAAGVPIVVAINKIDKPGANAEKVRQQLAEHGVQVEEWGGEVQAAEISAKMGLNIPELLDKILVATEILELKAVKDAPARGVVIETRQEKGRGTVCTVLVQRGTLKSGDVFVAGSNYGRVRAMYDERGLKRDEAIPGQPVQITGFEGAPHVGDQLVVFHEEREAKEIAFKRQQQIREQEMRMRESGGRGDFFALVEGEEKKELRLVIKGDVDGSVEAIADSLMRLTTDEVEVKIIRRAVGPINESDILLASASQAMVIGFNVHPMGKARDIAQREGVPVEVYRIIYELIEDIKGIIVGMHRREVAEEVVGMVEVRDLFKISRIGTIAGCYVTEGKIERNNRIRVLREGKEIYTGDIETLKRFKDDAKEVAQGYECGIKVANFNDLKVGDQLQSFKMVEVDRQIEVG